MSSISCLVAQLTVMLGQSFQQAFSVLAFLTNSEPNACGGFLRVYLTWKIYCFHLTYH